MKNAIIQSLLATATLVALVACGGGDSGGGGEDVAVTPLANNCTTGQIYGGTQHGCVATCNNGGFQQGGYGMIGGTCQYIGYINNNNGINSCGVGMVQTQMGCLNACADAPNMGNYQGRCIPQIYNNNNNNGGQFYIPPGYVQYYNQPAYFYNVQQYNMYVYWQQQQYRYYGAQWYYKVKRPRWSGSVWIGF